MEIIQSMFLNEDTSIHVPIRLETGIELTMLLTSPVFTMIQLLNIPVQRAITK